MPSCFVQYCRQTGTTFPAPKDPDLLRKWNEAIRHPTKTLTSKCSVCHIHFKAQDIIQVKSVSIPFQWSWTPKYGAVPSIFPIDYLDPSLLSMSNDSTIIETSFKERLESSVEQIVGEIETPIETLVPAKKSLSANDPFGFPSSNYTDCSVVSVQPSFQIQFANVKKENFDETESLTEAPTSAKEKFSYNQLISSFRNTTPGNIEWPSAKELPKTKGQNPLCKEILPLCLHTVEEIQKLTDANIVTPTLQVAIKATTDYTNRPLNLKLPSSKWKLSKCTDANYPTLKDQWDLHETYMLNGFPASRKMCRIMTDSQHIKFGVFYEVFNEAPSCYNSMEELQIMIDRFESARLCQGIAEKVILPLKKLSPLTDDCLSLKKDIEGCWRSDTCSRLLFEIASYTCLNCYELQETILSKQQKPPKSKKLKPTVPFSSKLKNRKKMVKLQTYTRNRNRSIKEPKSQKK